ncbi:MAG: NAD(P)-dependent oxidoreductase [Betaproteobacteria bacterium]|nr:NAD(P)-dependent oxidoreductase [Betaproteobacteria bacterium]
MCTMTDAASPSSTTQGVAFLGLGVMGFHMAAHLQRAGHRVTVYNRTASRAQAWVSTHGGRSAPTPCEAARNAQIVFTCVGNDDDLRAVTLGDQGALAGMQEGSVLVDHTTASAEIARALHQRAAEAGVGFLDAPVSGGEAGARNGTLTVMVGGDEIHANLARPVALAFARAFTRIGPSGSGQLAKMVNQICIAGLLQGLAEGINFGIRSGIDMQLVLEVIGKGAAQSWQMDHRGATMLENRFDFGFAVDWMRKDLGLCLDEARRNGAALPVVALVDQFYSDLQRMGSRRHDTSSLIRRLRETP